MEFLCVGRCPGSPASRSLGLLAQRFTVAGGSAAENLNKIGDLTAAGLCDPYGRQPSLNLIYLLLSLSQPIDIRAQWRGGGVSQLRLLPLPTGRRCSGTIQHVPMTTSSLLSIAPETHLLCSDNSAFFFGSSNVF